MTKVKFWVDNGATIASERSETFDVTKLGYTEDEWAALSEDDKFKEAEAWADNHNAKWKVMPRNPNAEGLEFQAGLYADHGKYHDLIAEVYTMARAEQIAREHNEVERLLAVMEKIAGMDFDVNQQPAAYAMREMARAAIAGVEGEGDND